MQKQKNQCMGAKQARVIMAMRLLLNLELGMNLSSLLVLVKLKEEL
jgi:hypothetical protein